MDLAIGLRVFVQEADQFFCRRGGCLPLHEGPHLGEGDIQAEGVDYIGQHFLAAGIVAICEVAHELLLSVGGRGRSVEDGLDFGVDLLFLGVGEHQAEHDLLIELGLLPLLGFHPVQEQLHHIGVVGVLAEQKVDCLLGYVRLEIEEGLEHVLHQRRPVANALPFGIQNSFKEVNVLVQEGLVVSLSRQH